MIWELWIIEHEEVLEETLLPSNHPQKQVLTHNHKLIITVEASSLEEAQEKINLVKK